MLVKTECIKLDLKKKIFQIFIQPNILVAMIFFFFENDKKCCKKKKKNVTGERACRLGV